MLAVNIGTVTSNRNPRVAILWHGDRESRDHATAENSKFRDVFAAFEEEGASAEPVVYHDDFADEVRYRLRDVDGVLVWVNPIEDGRDRALLDGMLRDVASSGVFVSTHPDVTSRMGTKAVLFRTRDMSWGGDVHLYETGEDIRRQLPVRLAGGSSRVLKENLGSSGSGVWRVQLGDPAAPPDPDPAVRVLHARLGSVETTMLLSEFASSISESGSVIDQPFQSPVPDGMVRCYLSHDQVVGFGHQYVTALLRSKAGSESPPPPPRTYHPASQAEFQALKARMEAEWVPELQRVLAIETESLPIIWDADFLVRERPQRGEPAHVLCEINVSSVFPFPDSALPALVSNTMARIANHRR